MCHHSNAFNSPSQPQPHFIGSNWPLIVDGRPNYQTIGCHTSGREYLPYSPRSLHWSYSPTPFVAPLAPATIACPVPPVIPNWQSSPIHSSEPRKTCMKNTRRSTILFYDKSKPFYGFTNFSPHKIVYRGKVYPTSEHLFQSMKFWGFRNDLAEHIRTCSHRPSVALSEARRFSSDVRRDWRSVNIQKMDTVLWHKFTQHPQLQAELLSTGNAELIENSPKDDFWGIGRHGNGRNELGKALERLRTKLRNGF